VFFKLLLVSRLEKFGQWPPVHRAL